MEGGNLVIVLVGSLTARIVVVTISSPTQAKFFIFILSTAHYPSHHYDCFRRSYVVLRGWKENLWSPEILEGPKLETLL